ncbi:MAG: GNAT family N-acetyltransferase [Polyangiaceae bacterium]|nr:GNAT family N-acetyltransferase [Polyangiaceae bacterium]
MHELDPRTAERALASVLALPMNTLFVQSLLRGDADGRLFGDDPADPRTFYAVHAYGMALLWGGPPRPGFRDGLRARLLDLDRAPVPEWLQVHPAAWADEIAAALAGAERAQRCTRVNFAFDRGAYLRARAQVAPPAPPARLVRTDEAMFARIDGSVVPRHFWRDGAQFVRAGGGFSLILGDEIAATAFCSFRHGASFELGIETAAGHRGRGFARQVACALIDECLRLDLEPIWSCRRENEASFQLAVRLGFAPTAFLPYFRLPDRLPGA